MLTVYLTDSDTTVRCDLKQQQPSLNYVMSLKKVFWSTGDLLEPVIPDDNDLTKMTWRSTAKDLETFKQLADNWQAIELRLRGYAAFAGKDAMNIIVQVALTKRKALFKALGAKADSLSLDIAMMHNIHHQLDQLLAREPAFTPSFLKQWPAFSQSLYLS
jgi:hypothetical protein